MSKLEKRATHDNNGKYRIFVKKTANSCYGEWSKKQEKLLAESVRGKDVVDLGAGTGVLSIAMVEYGANSVVSVDQVYDIDEVRQHVLRNMDGYTHKIKLCDSFRALLQKEKLLGNKTFLLSWPQTGKEWYVESGLQEIISLIQRNGLDLVLISCNTRYVHCGCFEMYDDLRKMYLLKQVYNGSITITVYKGAKTEVVERVAGLDEYLRTALSERVPEEDAIRLYDQLMTEGNTTIESPGYKFSSERRD